MKLYLRRLLTKDCNISLICRKNLCFVAFDFRRISFNYFPAFLEVF